MVVILSWKIFGRTEESFKSSKVLQKVRFRNMNASLQQKATHKTKRYDCFYSDQS